MSLKVYTLDQKEQWDSIVRSFEHYDVYWLSGYTRAFHIHGDGDPMLFYFENSSTRGINVVMKRDIAKDPKFADILETNCYFDFSTPYGYGGWLIEGNDTVELFDAYQNWVTENGIICEFVRFHPMVKNCEICKNYYDVVQLGEVVHMDLLSSEVIWENIISKNRNHIRKAIKSGVKIYNGRFPEIYERFQYIYNETMKKDEAKKYYFFEPEFYKSIMEDLPQNAQVFYAEMDGKVIAASIMLATNGYMNYHLSGSLQEYSSFAPTNLLLYQAALWGCENGCKTLYLGGGVGSGEDNLYKFKRTFFKGDLNHFSIGKKIFNIEKYNELVSLRNTENNTFFPQYRA